jgi:cytochrome c oxidase cbb3-type subunit 3
MAATDITALPGKPELMNQAIAGGAAAFKVHCVQCHGSGAAGAKGYPNLNDDEWLWGGDLATIEKTIADGIRQPGHDAKRACRQMPAFGRDGIFMPCADRQDVVSLCPDALRQEQAERRRRRVEQALFDRQLRRAMPRS